MGDKKYYHYDIKVDNIIGRAERLTKRMNRLRIGQTKGPFRAVLSAVDVLVEGIAVRLVHRMLNKNRIHRPPASALNSFARFIYAKRTYERIFMQHIIDLREEHAEALQAKRRWHARWIAARGNLIMVGTMAAHAFASCGKAFVKIWKLTP